MVINVRKSKINLDSRSLERDVQTAEKEGRTVTAELEWRSWRKGLVAQISRPDFEAPPRQSPRHHTIKHWKSWLSQVMNGSRWGDHWRKNREQEPWRRWRTGIRYWPYHSVEISHRERWDLEPTFRNWQIRNRRVIRVIYYFCICLK